MNNSFQVTHSLLSNKALHIFVAKNYEVGQVIRCNLLARGLNDTYCVETERDKFILRVYRSNWRNKSEIDFELDVLKYLSENGMAVSAPVKSIEGRMAIEVNAPEGIRYITLFTFANGETPKLNQEISYEYGKILANIHNLTDDLTTPHHRFALDFHHLVEKPLSLIQPLMEEYDVDVPYIEAWVHYLKEHIPPGLDFGFCHGDAHDWNAHWKEGTLTLFDFDCCGNGYRAYDLAVFLWTLKNHYKNDEQSHWESFLNGYTDIRPLAQIDLDTIPQFVAARRIWLAGIYLENEDVWGTGFINKNFFRQLVNQLKEDEGRLGILL